MVAIGGAATFGVVLISVVWMVSAGRAAARTDRTPGPSPPVAASPGTTRIAVSPLGPPEIWVTDLPVVGGVAKATPQPGPTRKPSSPATSAPPGPNARDCQPPYVVDAETGKKRWKLECL
jgi:hypothetical protein